MGDGERGKQCGEKVDWYKGERIHCECRFKLVEEREDGMRDRKELWEMNVGKRERRKRLEEKAMVEENEGWKVGEKRNLGKM